jgi:hypothetical protein
MDLLQRKNTGLLVRWAAAALGVVLKKRNACMK